MNCTKRRTGGLRMTNRMRLTKEQWKEARIAWESDPEASFRSVGEKFGVSKVAVLNASRRDGWVKTGSMPSINRAAQVRADGRELNGEVTGDGTKKPSPASVDASIDLRARLIQSHRAEWRKHAAMFPLEAIKDNFDIGKSAKISSEMLSIRQRSERVAWGMDSEAQTAEVVIERSYAKTSDS